MKYIRKYSEDILGDDLKDPEWVVKNNELLEEVKEDVKNYLSYLLDSNDFTNDVRVSNSENYGLIVAITILKVGYNTAFKFDDIKDELVPFCQIMSKKYDVVEYSTRYTMSLTNQRGMKLNYGRERFKIDDIVEDRVGDSNIIDFSIKIKANDRPAFVEPKKKTLLDKFKGIFR